MMKTIWQSVMSKEMEMQKTADWMVSYHKHYTVKY